MKEKKLKIIIIIVLAFYMAVGFIFGYLIGLDIGKQKASYMLVITITPMPDEAEPKPSKGGDKI